MEQGGLETLSPMLRLLVLLAVMHLVAICPKEAIGFGTTLVASQLGSDNNVGDSSKCTRTTTIPSCSIFNGP